MPTWAGRHERFYATAQGRAVLGLEVELLLRELPSGGIVASVGCGLGLHEAELERMRPRLLVVGLDQDAEMLRRAPRGLRTVRGRAEALPLRPGSLDAVIFVASLDFVPEPSRALEGAAAAMRPGGALVLHTLNPLSAWGRATLKPGAPAWSSPEELVGLVARALGAGPDARYALSIEGDAVREEAAPEEAALLVVAGRRAKP